MFPATRRSCRASRARSKICVRSAELQTQSCHVVVPSEPERRPPTAFRRRQVRRPKPHRRAVEGRSHHPVCPG
eukprot:5931258-Pyramimonas_sp.AAC.1